MSSHIATIEWTHSTGDFASKTYTRDHVVRFAGGVELAASSAPDFGGNPERVDPEAALTGALSSCHMLTFLAFAAAKGFAITRYEDRAVGTLGKNAEGRMAVTRVELDPKIVFEGRQPTPEELVQLHQRAHKGCFIANSVKTEVVVAGVELH